MKRLISVCTASTLILCLAVPGLAQNKTQNKAPGKPAAKSTSPAKRPANPVFQPIQDEAGLPRVLLIGDSISIGYTLAVREQLKGKANVHRPPTNCGPTTTGLKSIDQWLGDKPWDVIHFNWGLHDLKYMGPKGENLADPDAEGSHPQVPIDEYEKNLLTLVKRLKQTGAVLIWRSTTPVPPGAKGRIVGDSARYNEVAAKIMRANDIAIDDMYTYSKPRLSEIQLKANVHFTPMGSRWLGEKAAAAIEAALPKSPAATSAKSQQ